MTAIVEPMQVNTDGSLDVAAGFNYSKDNYISPPQGQGQGITAAIDDLLSLAANNRIFELSHQDTDAFGFEGVHIPMNTIYDLLGWIMSISFRSTPAIATSTARNYYLPLLALYARWCRLFSPAGDENAMVYIAWFTNTPPPHRILLGSTIGSPDVGSTILDMDLKSETTDYKKLDPKVSKKLAKGAVIGNERWQHLFNETNGGAGFQAPPSRPTVTPRRLCEGANVGLCAETFFFIYEGKRQRIPMSQVRGFAMTPEFRHGTTDTAYDEATAGRALRDPCGDCQKLVKQMECDWKPSFAVFPLQRDCGVI